MKRKTSPHQAALTDRTTIKVRFSEIDSMQIVWHGEYVRYFEDGREAFGKRYGLDYMSIYREGYVVPIVDLTCQFKQPLSFGEEAIVETRFIPDDASPEAILKMSEFLAENGVTSFIPTINASPEPELMKKMKAILKAMGKEKGARILGMHLEGPFLSPERIGGQLAEGLSAVDLDYMKRIVKAGQGKIINMTVAPELKNMRELALYCISQGIILQAGHTNASYEQMIEGMQVKIMHLTHMFNAMRPLHHREPGVVGAGLIHQELSCEFIGDGVHTNPKLITLLMQSKPIDKLVMITDALKYAHATPPEDADFYFDKCFKRKADEVIIGSGITMYDGFRNLLEFGVRVEDAVKMTSVNPAEIMKQNGKGMIIPGFDADLLIMDKDFNLIDTVVGGKFIREKK